jgi:FAD/FMN-containing dehydrogenase
VTGDALVRPASDALVAALHEVVAAPHVLTDPEVTEPFGRDWTGRFGVPPAVVVRPGSTTEVASVLQVCRDAGTPVVAQGGRTGLVGGSVPVHPGSVVLSTTRLTECGPVDPAGQVTVGAGVTLSSLARHVAAAGWAYGVDLAARDTATVGGTLATNAGGVRVVLHGDTRAQVLGVTAVLADGSVVSRLDGWPKDSSGYDLSRLFVGSEGTLAVITAARLRLVAPLPAQRETVLVGVASLGAAVELARSVRRRPGQLLAAEFLTDPVMDLVLDVSGWPFPLRERHAVYLLLEVADPDVAQQALAPCDDVAVDRRLWGYRERAPEALSVLGIVHHLDVGVPLDRLDELLERLPACVAPGQVLTFGHLIEGNVHVEVAGVPADDDRADDAVLHLVASLGGTVSSEHGVGAAKTRWLPLSRSATEIETMRRVKRALDPTGMLNPGVVLAE